VSTEEFTEEHIGTIITTTVTATITDFESRMDGPPRAIAIHARQLA
jgi:hypothetical protein